jgi:regulatory protein
MQANDVPENNPHNNEAVIAARNTALNLLARREHSSKELRLKLLHRGFTAETAATVLTGLAAEDLLSETRYAETYTRFRADKGYGPLRIYHELRERGVDKEIIDQILDQHADIWSVNLEHAHNKRFGSALPVDVAERLPRQRFLQQRGFTSEQIKQFFEQLL